MVLPSKKIQLSNVSSDFTTEGNKKTLKTLYVHRLLYRETQNLIEFLLGESSIFQPLNQHFIHTTIWNEKLKVK